jgi:hypothetical protein
MKLPFFFIYRKHISSSNVTMVYENCTSIAWYMKIVLPLHEIKKYCHLILGFVLYITTELPFDIITLH